MRARAARTAVHPAHVQIDGDRCPSFVGLPLERSFEAIIDGDALRNCIGAASILAKVDARRHDGRLSMRSTRSTASPRTRGTARRSTSRRSTPTARRRFTGAASQCAFRAPAESSRAALTARRALPTHHNRPTCFVHLHLHTEYSLVDSVVRIQSEGGDAPGLMDAVAAAGMPAVALTDQSNLFAMVKFYKAAQTAGVKPIIGVDLRVREPASALSRRRWCCCVRTSRLPNLTRLVSRSLSRRPAARALPPSIAAGSPLRT